MKPSIRLFVRALLGVAIGSYLVAAVALDDAAIQEVLKLQDAGFDDGTLISFIRRKQARFDLSADDLVSLHRRGVSPAVLDAMLASGRSTNVNPSGAVAAPPAVPPDATTPATQPATPALAATSGPPPAALSPEAAYFYQALTGYGRWLRAEDSQWCWQPTVAATSPGWRPYSDEGHWVSTDAGWYWLSNYPWGWAAFHYGRWQRHAQLGWIWFPGRVWASAWVIWRSGGEYCGWAPLPPAAVFDYARGRFLYHGRVAELDFDFGLDWIHFTFCYINELGDPPQRVPESEAEVRQIFDHTRVIAGYRTSRGVINGEMREYFFNVGIPLARVGEARGRPVETFAIRDLHDARVEGAQEWTIPERRILQAYRPRVGNKDEPRPPGRR